MMFINFITNTEENDEEPTAIHVYERKSLQEFMINQNGVHPGT